MSTQPNYFYSAMARRFSDLRKVYNTLTAINFDFDQLPANNEYRKYKEWVQDPQKRKRDNVPNSGRKSQMGLLAFGYPSTNDDNKMAVLVGKRAKDRWTALDAALKDEISLVDDPDTTYNNINGFVPSKVIAAERTTATTPISEITGLEYRKTTGSSYTIPFGRKTAADTEFERQAAIIDVFNETYVVTFTPEKVVRR